MDKLSKRELKYWKDLTEAIGISGCEHEVAKYLIDEYNKLGLTLIKDNLGSILALKKSKNPNAKKVMILGHLDEVGFIVKNIKDNGLIEPRLLGGFNKLTLPAQRLILKNKQNKIYYGCISSVSPHLLKGSDLSNLPLLFEFGFSNKEEALKNISINDPIVVEGSFKVINEDTILAKAIDNRYSLVLGLEILHTLKNVELDYDLYVGGSVQEEVGCIGAHSITTKIQPDLAIILDVSSADDLDNKSNLGRIGEGVLIRVSDRSMLSFDNLIKIQLNAVKKSKVNYQYFISPGGTDMGVVHTKFNGIKTLGHCICARSIHTNSSICKIKDYLDAKKSLIYLLKHLDFTKI